MAPREPHQQTTSTPGALGTLAHTRSPTRSHLPLQLGADDPRPASFTSSTLAAPGWPSAPLKGVRSIVKPATQATLAESSPDVLKPHPPWLRGLQAPRAVCVCKARLQAKDGGKAMVALVLAKTGVFSFQPGERVTCERLPNNRSVLVQGSHAVDDYKLFGSAKMPHMVVTLGKLLKDENALPATWETEVDLGDVLCPGQELDDSAPAEQLYPDGHNGHVMVLLQLRDA